MLTIRKFAIVFFTLFVILSVWLWWNHPRKVDMANYAPADSIAYFEINNLPAILEGLTETTAWKTLASPAGLKSDFGRLGWLSKISAWTGIGSAETVVFSRAQIAVAVIGITETNKIKPHYAVVIESHSGESRLMSVIEKRIGGFAQRAYGNPQIERKELNGARWLTWNASSGNRKIIAAIIGSVAIIGNDEEAVLKCLAVQRSESASIANNQELQTMRLRLGNEESAAFGFITSKGATKLFQILGANYLAQNIDNERELTIALSFLPQITTRLSGSIGWSARFSNGGVEDTYLFSAPKEISSRLSENIQSSSNASFKYTELLPAETYSLTQYRVDDPSLALRSLVTSLSISLDAISASAIPLIVNAAFRFYGIEDIEKFLQAIGQEIVTARLDKSGNSTVVIVSVKDESILKSIVYKKLGTQTPVSEKISETTMLVSPEPKRGAASFVNGYLIMGSTESVRRCLQAISKRETLQSNVPFGNSSTLTANSKSASAITFTDDDDSSRSLVVLFTTFNFSREKKPDFEKLEKALKELPFSKTETRFIDTGIERKTFSAFGQFGNLAIQYGSN